LRNADRLELKEINRRQRWRIRFDPARFNPDLTVAIRLDAANTSELDYYLLPRLDLRSV